MDPELRAALEALNTKMDSIDQRAVARDAETRQRVDTLAASVSSLATSVGSLATEVKATRAVAEAALSIAVQAREEAREGFEAVSREARQGFEAASTQAGALNDKALAAIKTLGDGLAIHREAVERHADEREHALMDAHIAPLEASATSCAEHLARHDKRLAVHDTEIKALQGQ